MNNNIMDQIANLRISKILFGQCFSQVLDKNWPYPLPLFVPVNFLSPTENRLSCYIHVQM